MSTLSQEAAPRSRMGVFAGIAVALHTLIIFGVVWNDRVWFEETPVSFDAPAASGSGADGAGRHAAGAPGDAPLQALEAAYIVRWVEHTERIGNRHAQTLHGSVTIQVVLDASGFVRSVTAHGGNRNLAAEARRVIMLAQPYPAFSEALRARREQIVIERLWVFGSDGVLVRRGVR